MEYGNVFGVILKKCSGRVMGISEISIFRKYRLFGRYLPTYLKYGLIKNVDDNNVFRLVRIMKNDIDVSN